MQELVIEISGRSPRDNPGGIPYRLLAEACIPTINVDDLGSIFEEHHICKSSSLGSDTAFAAQKLKLLGQNCGGVYNEDDHRFVFSSALVGIKSKARFKISNVKKVLLLEFHYSSINFSILGETSTNKYRQFCYIDKFASNTRKPCYRKDDRVMRPIYRCPEKFRESLLLFPKFVKGFCSDRY